MRRERLTRRDVLLAGVGAGLAGLTASIAGCTSTPPGGDGGTTEPPDFVRWLPAPGELEGRHGDPLEHYRAEFSDLSARRDSDVLPTRENNVYRLLGPAAGVNMADVETVIFSDVAHVLGGEFDAGAVADELESGGTRGREQFSEQFPAYTEESTYGAFTFYASGEPVRVLRFEPVVVGVSDGAVVLAPGPDPVETRIDRSKAVIDAEAGDVDRYPEASEDFDRLVEELGAGVGASVRTHPEAETTEPQPSGIGVFTRRFEGQVAVGSVTRIDGDAARTTFVRLFAEPDAVPSDELDAWVEELDERESNGGLFRGFDTSTSGRAWILTATIDVDALSDTRTPTPTDGPPTDPP